VASSKPCERWRVITPLAALVLFAAASPRADDTVFTVTAPTGTYTASTTDIEHWARVADRSSGGLQEARWQAFDLLLTFAWTDAEAAERGLALSSEVVHREFLAEMSRSFPKERDFQRFLRETGQTAADLERRIRLDMLSNLIREDVIAPVAASVTDAAVDAYIAQHGHKRPRRTIRKRLIADAEQATLDRFVEAWAVKWTSRTVCAEAYRSSRKCANHT
jgi:hypothetical protein